MHKNIFVFVVCGTKEHIDTLHFSLKYLKHFSVNEIFILTDRNRNEIKISHDNIIDIKTPKSFNNHQASIYLKTGIHKFLPKGNNYCYLDTDVVALNKEVDDVFKEFEAPITFAPDHCKINKFSPYAVFCSCSEKWENKRELFEKASVKHDKNRKITDTKTLKIQRELLSHFDYLKTNKIKRILTAIRYFIAIGRFNLNNEFYFDKKKRIWKTVENNIDILYEVPVKNIEQETGFTYNKWNQSWFDKDGNNIWKDECTHLKEYINNKFKIEVSENWQHWNGGVFLFNDKSHDFLTSWHKKTMRIFEDEKWRTRDQGTLITTAWEFNLQNHKTLSKKWNFIADYNKQGLEMKEGNLFTDNYWKTSYKPSFIHIYHHWNDKSWYIWNWVENLLNIKL